MTADARKLAIIAVLALLAGASWWWLRGQAPTAPAISGLRHEPDYTVENFTATVMNERGQKKYRLSAARLVHYPDDDTSHLTQPYLIQYPLQGAPTHTKADSAVVPAGAREIFMRGNVRVTRGTDAHGAGGAVRAEQMRIELDR